MIEKKVGTGQIVRQIGTVQSVFLELKDLQKDASRQSVFEIIGKLGSISRREPNGDALLHDIARHRIAVTSLAMDVTLMDYKAYPNIVNTRLETPVMIAAASNNIEFVKNAKTYNLKNNRPLSSMDQNRPYTFDFAKKNFAGFNAQDIALQHLNYEFARIVRRGQVLRAT